MEQEHDLWEQMNSYAVQKNNEHGKSIVNQRLKAIRANAQEKAYNKNRVNVAELAVDHAHAGVEEAVGIEEQHLVTDADSFNLYEQATTPEPHWTELQANDPMNAHQVVSQVQDLPMPNAGPSDDDTNEQEIRNEPNYEPSFSSSDFTKEVESIEAEFKAQPAAEQVIHAYQAEKSHQLDLDTMQAEFATNIDPMRNALPLENDGTLRDFFRNTRNGDTIQVFSSSQQNMTTGELIDHYRDSQDPLAQQHLNNAIDCGYREMLNTHKKERQAIFADPDSTSEDLEKFNKQAELEMKMFDYHLGNHEHGQHLDYIEKLEHGPQNEQTRALLYDAHASIPTAPSLDTMLPKYEAYQSVTPELAGKRQDLKESVKLQTEQKEVSLNNSTMDLNKDTQEVKQEVKAPEIKQEVNVPQVSDNILKLRETNPEQAKKVEANLNNPEYMEKVKRMYAKTQPDMTLVKNKSLKMA